MYKVKDLCLVYHSLQLHVSNTLVYMYMCNTPLFFNLKFFNQLENCRCVHNNLLPTEYCRFRLYGYMPIGVNGETDKQFSAINYYFFAHSASELVVCV